MTAPSPKEARVSSPILGEGDHREAMVVGVRPVRLQLSRRRGFDLQALSLATNGLPAVKVDRSTEWGNPWMVGLVECSCRSAGECDHNRFRCEDAAQAVAAFREWTETWINPRARLSSALSDLRGKNLACWCKRDPCHADVLLEIANR